jgi:SMP-30/Gluconolactonase/LRE-like region
MLSEASSTPGVATLLTSLAMGESPRWHGDRLWFCDWGAQEVLTVDRTGNREVILRTQFELPFCIDWLTNSELLVVAGREARLMRRQADGSLVTHTDLRPVSENVWNEIVVDGRGNAYVNAGPGIIALVTRDRTVRQVADGIAFPNGMAITPDNRTLIIAESHGRRLTAFDIASDGSLSNRRIWAPLGNGVPDGICIDAENAVWYADVPNKRCVRVLEGGRFCRPSMWTADALRACSAGTTRGHCSSSPRSGKGWRRFRRSLEPERVKCLSPRRLRPVSAGRKRRSSRTRIFSANERMVSSEMQFKLDKT